MKKYIRSERANLFEPNVYISMIVKLSGDLLSEVIEQAVYKAYEVFCPFIYGTVMSIFGRCGFTAKS